MQRIKKTTHSLRSPLILVILSMFICLCMIHLFSDRVMAEEKINYRLKWLFNASVVGDIIADANGLFAQAGLNVTVKEGGPERDAIRELESIAVRRKLGKTE